MPEPSAAYLRLMVEARMTHPAFDTSGPSLSGRAFYQPGVVPKPAPVVKPPKAKKVKGPKLKEWNRLVDVEAIREFIAAGHTVVAAAKHFRHNERTIRRNLGPLSLIRKPLKGGKKRIYTAEFRGNFVPEQVAWIKANGGAKVLRRLVDQAMGAA